LIIVFIIGVLDDVVNVSAQFVGLHVIDVGVNVNEPCVGVIVIVSINPADTTTPNVVDVPNVTKRGIFNVTEGLISIVFGATIHKLAPGPVMPNVMVAVIGVALERTLDDTITMKEAP
jgi:hypothetical protein